MTLAEAVTPERVGGSLWQYGLAIQSVQREQTRIPTGRDHRGGAGCLRCRVDRIEVCRNMGVVVVTVDQ